jgi:hypothetical protein
MGEKCENNWRTHRTDNVTQCTALPMQTITIKLFPTPKNWTNGFWLSFNSQNFGEQCKPNKQSQTDIQRSICDLLTIKVRRIQNSDFRIAKGNQYEKVWNRKSEWGTRWGTK